MDAIVKKEVKIEEDDEYQNTIPYETEPKFELIDEQDVKKEEIDDNEYQYGIPNEFRDYDEVELPGFVDETKEVKVEEEINDNENQLPYEYRNWMEQIIEEEQSRSTNISKRSAQCQRCYKFIAARYFAHAKVHAVSHMKLKRFKCDQCDYGSWHRDNVQRHINRQHKNNLCSVKEVQLSAEEQLEVRRLTRECFPGMDENSRSVITIDGKRFNKDNTPFEEEPTDEESRMTNKKVSQCQKCHNFVVMDHSVGNATHHAVTHTHLKRFKCDQCDYGSWRRHKVQEHINNQHKDASCSIKKIELSKEEQLEVRKLTEECFPDVIKVLKRRSTVNEKEVKVEEESSMISRKRQRTSDAD